MIENWELAHFPFEKDAWRHKVRIRGSEQDVQELVQTLGVNCGRPFVTLSQDFNWAFYLYGLTEDKREKVVAALKQLCPQGSVAGASPLSVDKEMPPMLEDVLEAAAKSLFGTQSKEPPAGGGASAPGPAAVSVRRPPKDAAAEPVLPVSATPLNGQYTFSEFVVGPNNRFTHAAAQAVAENPGKIYNPFFIYGGVGLGKSHLMHAIAHTIVAKNPGARYLYCTTEKFTSEVIEAIRQGRINALRDQYRGLDLLLIDDIQFLSGSDSTQEEFFHVFNTLHEMGKQIVITSDRPPKQMAALEDRLRSRFEWGLITDLKSPNLETRVAILKKKCVSMQMDLEDPVLMLVAEKTKSNIRELEGVLKKIHAYLNLTKEKIDLKFVGEMLSESGPQADAPEIPSAPAEEKKKAPETPAPAPPVLKKEEAPPAPIPPEPEKAAEIPVKSEVPPPAPREIEPVMPEPPKEEPPKTAGRKTISLASAPASRSSEAPPADVPATEPPLPAPAAKKISLDSAPKNAADPSEAPARVPEPAQAAEPAAAAEKPAPEKISPPAPAAVPKDAKKSSVESKPAGEPPPSSPETDAEDEDDPSLRPVEVVCFFPQDMENEFETLKQKFRDIIKKHRLKIRLSRLSSRPYAYGASVDYAAFASECSQHRCSTAIVLGPAPGGVLSEDEFAANLAAVLEKEKVTLQFIPWSELTKDYRYLNCALDLSLSVPLHG